MEQKFNYDSQWVNTETGEVMDIQSGSKIVSPETNKQRQQYAISADQTFSEKNEQFSETHNKRGSFFIAPCYETDLFWSQLTDHTLGKLVYLATYMDKNNCICHDGNWEREGNVSKRNPIPMTKEEIREVLGVNRKTFAGFLRECITKEAIIETDNGYFLSKKMFRFCDDTGINRHKVPMVKMFKHAIRYMYTHTDERSRKSLVHLYRLIPFINLTYNGLCSNPFETDKNEIEVLSLGIICDKLGIDRSHQKRFLDKLKSLRFIDKEGVECSVISYRWIYYDKDIFWVTINPQFYSGYISEEAMVEMVNEFRIETNKKELEKGVDI